MASLKNSSSEVNLIDEKVHQLFNIMHQHFLNVMIPEMEASGIVRVKPPVLDERQLNYVKKLFEKELLPVLTPIAVSDDRSFPMLNNLRLYLIVSLVDVSQSSKKYAVVEIPQNFPRIVSLPDGQGYPFVLLEDVISLYSSSLFSGYEVVDKGFMRLTRGAELTFDEEKDEDFMKVMAEALRLRRSADVVRLEISAPQEILEFFKEKLGLSNTEIYETHSWLDLKGISQLAMQPGFEDLKRPTWIPKAKSEFEKNDDIWRVLKEKNVHVIHPYESFDSVSRFIANAADDPDVLAIKQTLYRAGQDSSIIHSLERAAEKGKQVTVLVELKARFDEEKNIEWARRLDMAGANVLYGVAGLKTHAKVCLVIRREPDGIKRYVHLSTGNYNEKTARLYSDIGFFTSDENIAGDISGFFNMITGYSQPIPWSKIEVAPYGLRTRLIRLILREAMRSTKERPGLIMAKMNSLVDPQIIEALYKASKANVEIKLNVRGMCCLRPGVKDLSENIEVVSIVDMFLEHSRIFYFSNAGDDELYLSSADWMPRNLDRRLEIMFPIEDKENKREMEELLRLYFKDNVKAWQLQPNGSYKKIAPGTKKKFRVQEHLCKKSLEQEELINRSFPRELKPQKPGNPKTL
jgi:polyphosphate kinase